MINKITSMLNKIIAFIVRPVNLAVITIGLLIYFGFFFGASIAGTGCNLGSWSVSNYDISQGKLYVDAGINSEVNGGCLGTYDVAYKGIPVLDNDKSACEFFGFRWNDETNGDGYHCTYSSGSKAIVGLPQTTTGSCTITCTDSRGCGGIGLTAGQKKTYDFFPEFRTTEPIINYPAGYNTWTPITCNSQIEIQYPVTQTTPPQNGAIVEPSSSSSNQPAQEIPGTSSQDTRQISLIDKIGNSFNDFIDSIFNFFGGLFR